MTTPKHIPWLALLAWPVLVGGCGDDPNQGYTMRPIYREGIATVAVPIWNRGKDVYRREIEFRLTEALQKRIELNTPYKVAPRERADTLLEGTIERIDQRVLEFDPDSGRPREQEISMTVSFTWTDLRTGTVLLKRTRFVASAVYIPLTPFNEDFYQGSEADIDKMARRIVEQMEAPWGKEPPAATAPVED
jgi:hypothetical protein